MNDTSKARQVFLTGGTGFVGGHIARRLKVRGFRVRALVRDPDRAAGLRELGAELVVGDVTDAASLGGDMLSGCSAVIHLVAIIRERPPRATFQSVNARGTENVLAATRLADVGKFVYMSALGARAEGTDYHRTKSEAEAMVRAAGIPYVIFRPSIIVGPGSEFIQLLTRTMRLAPIMPVIGDGSYRLQPVNVRDVAEAFVQAVERDDLRDRIFEIGGPHKLTFNRVLEIVGEEMGLRRAKLHLPTGLVKPLVDVVSGLRLPTPITRDQLAMLLEENVVSGENHTLREVFGIDPITLRTTLQEMAG